MLSDLAHNPFFSIEEVPSWITSHGYQLFLTHDDLETATSWNLDDVSTKQLKGYCSYVNHLISFLISKQIDPMTCRWLVSTTGIIPSSALRIPRYGSVSSHSRHLQIENMTSPASSQAPSRSQSRASSCISIYLSSHAGSPASFTSDMLSHPLSSMSMARDDASDNNGLPDNLCTYSHIP
jgi:hypothetical protein